MQGFLGFPQQEEAVLTTLTEEVLKSSKEMGEKLDKDAVRPSLARRLGMDAGALPSADRNVEGIVDDARRHSEVQSRAYGNSSAGMRRSFRRAAAT